MDVAKGTDRSHGHDDTLPLAIVSRAQEQEMAATMAEDANISMGNHLGSDGVMEDVAKETDRNRIHVHGETLPAQEQEMAAIMAEDANMSMGNQLGLGRVTEDEAKETDRSHVRGDTLPVAIVSRAQEQEMTAIIAEDISIQMGNQLGLGRVTDEEAPPPRMILPIDNDNREISTNDDAAVAAPDNQTNEEPQNIDNEEKSESGDDESGEIHIFDAYLVVDEVDGRNSPSPPPQPAAAPIIIDGYAEPLLPWWKQTRNRALLAVVCLVLIVAAVAITASFSHDNDAPAAVTTVLVVVNTTSPPSSSVAPTPQLTYAPTGMPSSCLNWGWRRLELPLNEPTSPKMLVDGRNAVFVVREANTSSIYVVFYYFRLEWPWGWTRTGIFIERYEELEEEDRGNDDEDRIIYDYSLALSGPTALVGFSRKDTETGGVGAGLVHVFEQRDGGNVPSWTKAGEPLLPDDGGGGGANFGYRLDLQGDLAVVGALGESALYIFQKTAASSSGGGYWQQRLKFDIDYDMMDLFLRDDVIAAHDRFYSELHLYRYNQGLNRIVPLQDAIVVDPTRREYPIFSEQVEATGTRTAVVKLSMSKDHIVYSTETYNNDDSKWTMKRVFVYQKEGAGDGNNQTFTFRQVFNASDYENDAFGWDLTLHQDVLVIGGNGQNVVFTQRENGDFEEILHFDQRLHLIQMSGRTVIFTDSENKVCYLNFADCVQQMPTQSPSSSVAPNSTPSALSKASIINPTSSPLASTSIPSSLPTSSLGPSISVAPTHTSTSSSAPTICYDIRVVITTVGANMKGFENDVTSWELYRKRSRELILQGGQFQDDAIVEYEAECIEQDDYVFKITNSGGNGFGECSTCGYYLYVDERYIGGNMDFADVDIVNFQLPLYQRELKDDGIFFNGQPSCVGDFFLTIFTGDNPQLITWDVINEDRETLVEGGPYSKKGGSYREFACLPDGNFTFTIYNAEDGGSPLSLPYVKYFFGVEWDTIILHSSLQWFNISESTSFVLGT